MDKGDKMNVGDLVRFVDCFGNDMRLGLVLVADVDYVKVLGIGWVRQNQLEVINASR